MKKSMWVAAALIGMALPASAAPAPVPPPAAEAAPAPVPLPKEAARPATLDIQQQVDAAMKEYQQKNYGRAAGALDFIAGQLRAMKSEALAQFLPAAPKGWTAKDDPAARFGRNIPTMGSSASRLYQSGGEEVKLTVTADSELMGALRKLAGNSTPPMQFMGHDYIFKIGDASMPEIMRKNEGTLYVSDKLTISVQGKTLTDQQAQGFLGLIDLARLTIEADK